MPNTFLTGNPEDHLDPHHDDRHEPRDPKHDDRHDRRDPKHDEKRDHRDHKDRRKKIDVEVLKEDIISDLKTLPKVGSIEGGFVLTQIIDVEKAIHLKDVTCLLEKKLPVQLAVICFKTD